jgi:hypothetical protein
MRLWKEYNDKLVQRGEKEDATWGLNWTQSHAFENRYDRLSQ